VPNETFVIKGSDINQQKETLAMNWLDPSVITILVNAIAILVVVFWNWKQYKQMNKQLKIQNEHLQQQNEQIRHNYFSTYTQRYQEISLNFPVNINDANFSYEALDKKERDNALRYMRVYFDLCSEEFFLNERGHIDEDVWKEWKQGMEFNFNKTAFKSAWERFIKDTGYYTDFANFVNSKMNLCKEYPSRSPVLETACSSN
jgi:hypothetical protein